jgi:pantoate--beta-alanine ligase
MVQPDVAVFGEKDYQQLLIIKRMVADLFMPVNIIGVETCREADGLAMSSRNNYLSDEQRRIASTLYEALADVAWQVKQQRQQQKLAQDTVNRLEQDALERLQNAGFKPDYVHICDADTLSPASSDSASIRILAAAWLGNARLIDNVPVD